MVQATLRGASMGTKLLYSSFLILTGLAYIAAIAFVYMTHAHVDGKPGIDMADIVESYYGNGGITTLAAAVRGPMRAHIQPGERKVVLAWLDSGATKAGYEAAVKPILAKDCMACHNAASSAALRIPNLSTFQGLQQVTKVDKGASIQTLVRLSHIHLFAIALVLFAIGFVFLNAELAPWIQYPLIVLPFAGILADVASWFLTKRYPVFAYVVVFGGGIMGLAMAAQILIALYQMWVSWEPAPRRAERPASIRQDSPRPV